MQCWCTSISSRSEKLIGLGFLKNIFTNYCLNLIYDKILRYCLICLIYYGWNWNLIRLIIFISYWLWFNNCKPILLQYILAIFYNFLPFAINYKIVLLYNNCINGDQTKDNKLLPTMIMAWYHPNRYCLWYFDLDSLTTIACWCWQGFNKSRNMKNLCSKGLSERDYNSYNGVPWKCKQLVVLMVV